MLNVNFEKKWIIFIENHQIRFIIFDALKKPSFVIDNQFNCYLFKERPVATDWKNKIGNIDKRALNVVFNDYYNNYKDFFADQS